MIGTSLPEYIFIRVCIGGLRLIAPLACSHILASVYAGRLLGPTWLGAYAALESAFFLFVYLPRRTFLQRAATHPPLTSRAEREALFTRCLAEVPDYDAFSVWFFAAPASTLKRGNVVSWLLWALFGAEQSRPEWEDEISGYVEGVERLIGKPLPPGLNPAVKCMRVTLEPVDMTHRPLLWYMLVALVDTITNASLHYLGFEHYASPTWFSVFPPRPLTLFSRPAPIPGSLAYWHRPHRSQTKHPIIFLHGIGIGLWPYLPFFRTLITADPDVGMIALEHLPVSMHISPPPPSRHVLADVLARTCAKHQFRDVVLVAHSYGTFLATDLLRPYTALPDAPPAPRVAAVLLVDAIPLLLHLPAVAHNFVYRFPGARRANEWQLWYFASRDPDIARALARHFFWADGVLWRDELTAGGRRAAVALGSADQIVDAERVRRYLTKEDVPTEEMGGGGLEVLWFPGRDHAVVFDRPDDRQVLIDVVQRFCLGSVSPARRVNTHSVGQLHVACAWNRPADSGSVHRDLDFLAYI